jgi:hypothetical protein
MPDFCIFESVVSALHLESVNWKLLAEPILFVVLVPMYEMWPKQGI